MDLKETFEHSGFNSASVVTEVYRFFHEASHSFYRLEIAKQFATERYTATPYREVDNGDAGPLTLETLIDFPWVDQPTSEGALHDALDFLGDRLR